MLIGILALQGAFIEHRHLLDKLGVESVEIRQLRDLDKPIDGLILPGGESTTMGKLLRDLALYEPIRERVLAGMPVFGTCAGMILLAKEISNDNRRFFQTMDITVKRNAYGRQLGSFRAEAAFAADGKIPMVFIRAPYIESAGPDVQILATVDGHGVAARQKNMLATAFHPELTHDTTVHRYFLDMIRSAQKKSD